MDSLSSDVPQKQCQACENYFDATPKYFYVKSKRTSKPDLDSMCKPCRQANNKERYYKNHPRKEGSTTPEGYKQCKNCEKVLPATVEFFQIRREGKDGFRNQCKQCLANQLEQNRLNNPPPQEKQCCRCKSTYPIALFSKDPHTKDGHVGACKNCLNTTNKHILAVLPVPEGQKRCMKCGELRTDSLECFPMGTYGQRNHCRECINTLARETYRKHHPRETIPEGFKRCSMCKEIKPATKEHFNYRNIAAEQLHCYCRGCNKIYGEQLYANGTRVVDFPDGTVKQCPSCQKMFPATSEYFYKRRIVYGGLDATCKMCCRERGRIGYQRIDTTYTPTATKICTRCQMIKPASTEFFHAKRDGAYGLVSICKECKSKYDKRYLQEHPLERRGKYHRRRMRLRSNGGAHTTDDIRQQYKRQKGRCYYCRKRMQKYHIEHTDPVTRGGSNNMGNIVLACPTCNVRKGRKRPHEWPEGGRLL